jgi:hypothetical protein
MYSGKIAVPPGGGEIRKIYCYLRKKIVSLDNEFNVKKNQNWSVPIVLVESFVLWRFLEITLYNNVNTIIHKHFCLTVTILIVYCGF